MGKTEMLRKAIQDFYNSDQEVSDYMHLFIVVHAALRQGDGLLWSAVNKILQEEIGYTFDSCSCKICGKIGGH